MAYILLLIIIFLLFAFVIFIGAPYLPTLKNQQQQAIKLFNLKKGSTILDVGSGDGRFLLLAAKSGYKAVGIEANPILVIVSHIVCFRQRRNIKIIWANMWTCQWPKVDGIYVFLHTKYMQKLNDKILSLIDANDVFVVSYAFKIPNKKPTKTKNGLYLYHYKKTG